MVAIVHSVALWPAKNSLGEFWRPIALCLGLFGRLDCGARRHPMELNALGIDLGKTVFHLVGHFESSCGGPSH